MALPDNVDTCLVTGTFVYADGSIPTGTVEFTPTPCRFNDTENIPPTILLSAPIVAVVGPTGEFAQQVPATDDPDLNPLDWTYRVRVRLNGTGPGVVYSFDMAAPIGTVDLATVTPVESSTGTAIVVGPAGPAGADGPPGTPGEGVPEGGASGEVLAKLSGDDFDTTWTAASAPGLHAATHATGSTDPVTITQAQVTGLTADLAAKATAAALTAHESDTTAVHGIADTSTLATTTDLTTHAADTTNVHGITDTSLLATTASVTLKADKATTITPTAPLTGGGDLSSNRTLAVSTFGTSASGVVPASGGGTANYLRADGTWTAPPGAFAGVGNTATYSYNTATTEPPTGNQLRLNSTTFTAATRLWVMQTTVDGLDVSIGLARILAGHQIYFQDRDDASHWVKYNVTADGVDDGAYYDFTVTYNTGPGGIPAGQIELQAIAPGTVGVPPGGTTNQALTKDTSADYDVEWSDVVANGGGITTIMSISQAAYDALSPPNATTLYVVTS